MFLSVIKFYVKLEVTSLQSKIEIFTVLLLPLSVLITQPLETRCTPLSPPHHQPLAVSCPRVDLEVHPEPWVFLVLSRGSFCLITGLLSPGPWLPCGPLATWDLCESPSPVPHRAVPPDSAHWQPVWPAVRPAPPPPLCSHTLSAPGHPAGVCDVGRAEALTGVFLFRSHHLCREVLLVPQTVANWLWGLQTRDGIEASCGKVLL